MNLLRCATHTVRDVDAAVARYTRWLDYRVADAGMVPADLAASWGAPASAGRPFVLFRPASGADCLVRFVEGDPVPDYLPIRSYGWAAIEICVQDVLAVNARMMGSPFDVIGPPTRIAGIPTIYPMQVRGPDQETLYLTEITTDAPDSGLPQPKSMIDTPFIVVLACPDMRATAHWFERVLKLDLSDPIAIRYSMISQAFGLPASDLHEIVTARWGDDIFLELDQYPSGTVERPAHRDALPPGVSICTLMHPEFDQLAAEWLTPPVVRPGPLYDSRRVGVLRTPEGALLEIIDGA
jgi:hypothetical protein